MEFLFTLIVDESEKNIQPARSPGTKKRPNGVLLIFTFSGVPNYPSADYGHHAAAKEIFDAANLDEVEPDFCETKISKRAFKVKQESRHALCGQRDAPSLYGR